MNQSAQNPVAQQFDFAQLFNLEADDRIDGDTLVLGGMLHIQLKPIETAYKAADAAGLVSGAIVKFKHSNDIGVVTGRNLNVMSGIYSPSRVPVLIQSGRGYYEYEANAATVIPLGCRIVGLTKDDTLVDGIVNRTSITDGEATLHLNNQDIKVRDLAVLEVEGQAH